MPEWWYEFSYDPLVAAVVSGLVVALATSLVTFIIAGKFRAHCARCCPRFRIKVKHR